MTFSQLQIFVVLAEAQGFSLAAQRLGISQSAVSHALKKLEVSLGVTLIERQKSSAVVTEAGSRLLPRALEILGLSETVKQEALAARGLQLGSLRIASFGPTSSLRLLPQILARFRKNYPDIDVQVDEGDDEQVIQWLQERRVDVGFVVLPDERFETHVLAKDQIVAIVPIDSQLADKVKLRLDDLCEDPFIMTEAGSAGLINRLFAGNKKSPDIRYRNTQLLSTLAMVESGEGIALVAEFALPPATTSVGYAVKSLTPKCSRTVGIALHNARQASPATRAFVKLAVEMKNKRELL